MRFRIIAAWRVLRGQYVASPRVQCPSVWLNPQTMNGTTATNTSVTWRWTNAG